MFECAMSTEPLLAMPPPPPAVLPLMVEFRTVAVPALNRPPPLPDDVFAESVLRSTSSVPELCTPAPSFALLAATVLSRRVRLVPAAVRMPPPLLLPTAPPDNRRPRRVTVVAVDARSKTRSPDATMLVAAAPLGFAAPTIVTGLVRSRSPVSAPAPPFKRYVPAGTVIVAPVDAFAAATAARNEHEAVATPAVHDAADVRSFVVPTMNCGGTAATTTVGAAAVGIKANTLTATTNKPTRLQLMCVLHQSPTRNTKG